MNRTLLKIKDHYKKQLTRIPPFIDSKCLVEHEAYDDILEININILSLVTPIVLNDKRIIDIAIYCSNLLDSAYDSLESGNRQDKFLLYCDIIIDLVESLQGDLLDTEEYEAMANLKKFDDIFHHSGLDKGGEML